MDKDKINQLIELIKQSDVRKIKLDRECTAIAHSDGKNEFDLTVTINLRDDSGDILERVACILEGRKADGQR